MEVGEKWLLVFRTPSCVFGGFLLSDLPCVHIIFYQSTLSCLPALVTILRAFCVNIEYGGYEPYQIFSVWTRVGLH
jgi:hypothetical protein